MAAWFSTLRYEALHLGHCKAHKVQPFANPILPAKIHCWKEHYGAIGSNQALT